MPEADFLAILRILVEDHVEFVVAGVIAAALQGAPISRTTDNIQRLLRWNGSGSR